MKCNSSSTHNRIPTKENRDSDNKYYGKQILIFITYVDKQNSVIRKFQAHGIISKVSAKKLKVSLLGIHLNKFFVIPNRIIEAHPGIYTLCNTGDVVDNPDYIFDWKLIKNKRFYFNYLEGLF